MELGREGATEESRGRKRTTEESGGRERATEESVGREGATEESGGREGGRRGVERRADERTGKNTLLPTCNNQPFMEENSINVTGA